MRTSCPILSLTLLLSICLVSPLLGAKVKSYPNPKADFTAYKTYQWLPPRVLTKTGIDENHPASPVLKEIVVRQLSQQGLSELAEGADLQVQAFVLTESSLQLEAMIFSTFAVDQGDVMAIGSPIMTISRYNKEGSLYINLIDTRTKKSAWVAAVTDSLPDKALSPEQVRAKLDKAATNIFKKYPLKRK